MKLYPTTHIAYGDAMCNEACPTGTVLVCGEGVVGVCCAWPIAVTRKHGDFHGSTVSAPKLIEHGMGTLTLEHIREAQRVAINLGWELDPML